MKLTPARTFRMDAVALEAALPQTRRYPVSNHIERRPLTPNTEANLRAACRALVNSHSGAAERAYEVQGDSQANLERLHRTAGLYTSQRLNDNQKPVPPIPPHRAAGGDSTTSRVPRDSPHNYLVQPTLHPGRNAMTTKSTRRTDTSRAEKALGKRPAKKSVRKDSAQLTEVQSTPKNRSSLQFSSFKWSNLAPSARASEQNLSRTTRDSSDRAPSDDVHLSRSRSVPYSLSGSARTSFTNLAKNFKTDLQEYIRPGSSSVSRKGSLTSMRSAAEGDADRPDSSGHVWRSWGFNRRSSRGSLRGSRPSSSSRSRKNSGEGTTEPDSKKVDLNRELPPLPGLDSWKETRPTTHIANLMKIDVSEKDPAVRTAALDSSCVGSPTESIPPFTRTKSEHARDIYQPRRQNSSQANPQSLPSGPPSIQPSPRTSSEKPPSKRDSQQEQFPKRISSKRALHSDSKHAGDRKGASTRTSMKISIESNRENQPTESKSSPNLREGKPVRPNYSRKGMSSTSSLSTRSASRPQSRPTASTKHLPMYTNVVEIKAMKSPPKKERGLRKVLSVLAFRGNNGDWMSRVERKGAKEGVIFQDEKATGAAVVRY